MKSVYMLPTPSEAQNDLTNSINAICLRLQKHLPAYGWEVTENELEADLTAYHAGQSGGAGSPMVAVAHGVYPTAYGKNTATWHWYANAGVIRNLRGAKQVTVPSSWVAEIIQRDMGFTPHVIPWAVDINEWTPQKEHGGYVLWNKTRTDGVCAPDTLNTLAAKMPQQRFLSTFGGGTPNLKVIGRQPYELMKPLIMNAGVYLNEVKETFSIGALEALASGVPVVGFRHGAIPDFVEHGINGYLVDVGDIDGLVEGIGYCLKYRDTLAANARETAKAYSWELCASRFADVFDLALAPAPDYKLSVVIPTYNYAHYLGEALKSVIQQTVDFDYEIIIVDDGSKDSPDLVMYEVLKECYPHLAVAQDDIHYYRKENSGVADTRNYGIQRAKGEYILCLDSDDRLGSPHFLQILADALDSDPTFGIAFTGLTVMNEAGELSSNVNGFPNGFDYDRQLQGYNQVPTACLFRKEAWRRAGGYRKEVQPAEDANIWVRMGALGYNARQVTTEGWFNYRLHSASLSSEVRTGQKREPNWRNFPYVTDGNHPIASIAKAPRGSHPARNYDQPIVSVIIPVGKGHEGLVQRAIDSVEAQTERHWELVVVNDTGQPLNLINDAYIRLINTKGNMGAGYARNRGVEACRAKLITFLDADDMFLPLFLEKMIYAYKKTGRYIYSDWISINKDGQQEEHETPDYDIKTIFTRVFFHSVNILIPKKQFLEVGGFDEEMPTWEDVDLMYKLAVKGFCGQRLAQKLLIYDYNSGQRRESGYQNRQQYLDFLKTRYKEYVEKPEMCSCAGSPVGKAYVNGDGNFMSQAADDEMIRIEYAGAGAGHELIGSATGQQYGYRMAGDIFYVWKRDMVAQPTKFIPFAAFDETPESTPIPDAPDLVAAR